MDNPEFEFFVKSFMDKMSPDRNNFRNRYTLNTISEIYTPSDKVYALVVLCSQQKLWENQKIDSKNKVKVCKMKPNCLNPEGRGWTVNEINLYKAVLNKVKSQHIEQRH